MIHFHLQRLSSIRYLLLSTKSGLIIVLIFILISVNMINLSSGTSHSDILMPNKPSNLISRFDESMTIVPSIDSEIPSLNNSLSFISGNITNTHKSVIDSISNSVNVSKDFLSLKSSNKHGFSKDNHLITSSVHRSMRVKRGLIQLASMIRCVSGCEPFQYKGYGCFCGLFGSGKPVDPIDKCCLKHDQCYAMAPCHQLLLYLMPYSWDCVAPGYANCALTDYEQSKDKCGFSLCECDRVFAECISKYPCPSSKAKCPYKPMVLTVYGK